MTTTVSVDGAQLSVRPIEVTDVDRLARMAQRLSPKSIYFRFFAPLPRLSRSTLVWLADVDHCRRDALVAMDGDEIVGVARYEQLSDPGPAGGRDAEIAVTVEDAWQHRGLGWQLTRRLSALASDRGCDAFRATILPDNRAALDLMRKLAPDATVRFTDGTYEARLPLRATTAHRETDRSSSRGGHQCWRASSANPCNPSSSSASPSSVTRRPDHVPNT
ncbi:MAG: N-acetyltransferase family protein [Acidimicrobiia bacterium]